MSVDRFARGAALVLGAALAASGCSATKLVGGGGYTDANITAARRSAVRYFLAKDVLVVEAELKQNREIRLSVKQDSGTKKYVFEATAKLKLDSATATITSKTVADTSAFFQVDLEPGDAAEDTVSVEVSDKGLLKSINVASTSQAGEIAKNVLQVAATVAAVAGGLPAIPDGLVKQIHALFDTEQKAAPKLEISLKNAPLDVLHLLHEDPTARELWVRKLTLEALIERRAQERNQIEDTIQKGGKGEIDNIKARLALLDASIKRSQDDRQAVVDLLEAKLTKLKKSLGTEALSRKITVIFELDEVPPPSALAPRLAPTEVAARIQAYPKMAQLFEETKIAFTLDLPKFSPADPDAVPKPGVAANPAVDDEGRVFFRQSFPGVLRLYANAMLPPRPALPTPGQTSKPASPAADAEQLRFVEDRVLDLMPASAPHLFVAFAPRDFATRRLSLSFDEKGRLSKLERSGTAALAGASGALADGLAKARDEYAGTLKKLVEIQDTRRTLSLEDIQGQIDQVKKQRELLDARVGLEGAAADADLVLQKQHLDAELAALQARAAYEAQRDTVQQKLEVEKLKARLDQLNAELALIKARMELEKAEPGRTTSPPAK